MTTSTATLYDGLFLMNQAASSDFNAAVSHIQEILDRAGARTVSLSRWDDRRLAYPIHGQKRGLYIQALFEVEGSKLNFIERDCNLSDQVIRAMVVRGEYLGEVEIENAKNESQAARDEQAIRSAGDEAESDGATDGDGDSDSDSAE